MSFLISTSWDDGHALDTRLVELLDAAHSASRSTTCTPT